MSGANGHDDWPAAEASVLGALLLGAPFAQVAPILGPEHFTRADAALTFRAIGALSAAGTAVDTTTVTTQLTQTGDLQAAGGIAALSELARNTPSAANAAAYARIVRDRADCGRVRQLVQESDDSELLETVQGVLTARAALASPREAPQPMDWRALKGRTAPPRVWWIQDWLTPAPTLCAGGGGSGKSLLWQTLCTALALGREFIAAAAAPLRVIMLACEDDRDELWRRQAAICAYFDVPIESIADILTLVPRYGCDNTLFAMAYGQPTFTPEFLLLREQVNDLRADVLVADNNAHTFGANESDRHQVTMFVNGTNGIVRGRPFAPVFLGHTSRAQGSEYSGSAAWENACRMRMYLGPTLPDQKPEEEDEPPDEDTMYLARRKVNYAAKDWRRLKFERGLWVPEHYAGQRFDAAARNDLAERIVLKGFVRLKGAGITASDGKNSPDFLPRQILEKGYAEGHTRKELAAAMNRLIGAGKLKRGEVGKYSNRSPRFGLVIP
jgi:hypothetical protein